jgi:hypothetical protein
VAERSEVARNGLDGLARNKASRFPAINGRSGAFRHRADRADAPDQRSHTEAPRFNPLRGGTQIRRAAAHSSPLGSSPKVVSAPTSIPRSLLGHLTLTLHETNQRRPAVVAET